jgi:hypothetical protein
MLVETLVLQAAAEALPKAILRRFAWRDAAPFDVVLLLPSQRSEVFWRHAVTRPTNKPMTSISVPNQFQPEHILV